jgi:hypothetical protein
VLPLKNTLGIFDRVAASPQFFAFSFESFQRRKKLP